MYEGNILTESEESLNGPVAKQEMLPVILREREVTTCNMVGGCSNNDARSRALTSRLLLIITATISEC